MKMSKRKLRLSNASKATQVVIARGVTDSRVYVPDHCAILLFIYFNVFSILLFNSVQGKGMHGAAVEALA